MVVSDAIPKLSSGLSHLTYHATYAPFTPSDSEQRLRPLYYRGCWHRVSRLFLLRYHQLTQVINPAILFTHDRSLQSEDLILHAASLHQGCPHCERFSTAATRRCLDRVSVPVWLVVLSDQLPVVAWVRFHAYRRIKPHAPPFVRVPVNSFEFQPCDRTPQAGHLLRERRHRRV